jgi:dTDP-4-dehydrorhamnose reductase
VKVLVTGRSGQLACGLLEAAVPLGVEVVAVGRPDIDLVDEKSVARVISRERPDAVVNAAAYTAVDRAEAESAIARAVNALGAEHVARACEVHSIPIIQISTDYVFDGMKDGPYSEDDPTGPVNSYGRSKLEGERAVAKTCERHLILRSAWLHSPWAPTS